MKNNYKRNYRKNLLEDFRTSLSSFNFVMIYVIHKMFVLLKNDLSYVKNSIFDCFFKEYNKFLFI